jgi:hypothetical protein
MVISILELQPFIIIYQGVYIENLKFMETNIVSRHILGSGGLTLITLESRKGLKNVTMQWPIIF